MRNRTPVDVDALLGLEGSLPSKELPQEAAPVFTNFSIESEPVELSEDDPNKLTLFTKFGRVGGKAMGELEDLTANAVFDDPRVLGVEPGQWVDFKNGCPFSPHGRNSKGNGIALKCDGDWLNFICRDPEHKHPEGVLRTGKDGRNFWMWSLKNPASTGYTGRKFLPFKIGDHVEFAKAVLTRLGDCAWDSGDRVRVFDSRFAPKGKGSHQASKTAGLWVIVPEDDIKRVIRELSGEWVLTGKDKHKQVKISDADVRGIYKQLLSMLRQGHASNHLGLISKFADLPARVVFRGSAWDVESGKIVYAEKMRSMYCTNEEQLDVPYGGGGAPEQFLQFLREVWEGHADVEQRILFLQEWVGMALAGKIVEVETHLLLQGTTNGMNGKSRLMTIISGLFPQIQVSGLTFSDLAQQFRPAMLATSRLNIYADVRAEVVNASTAKQVLSGDMILMERKGENAIVGRPKAAWIIGVNDTFIPSEGDKALFRRWKVLTFDRRFSGDSAKTSVAEDILAAEKALIIHWALEGLKRWNANRKFTEFSSQDAAMKAWHTRVDSAEQWLEECVIPLPDKANQGDWIGRRAHYLAYSEWAKKGGYVPVAERRFSETIVRHGLASAQVSRDGKQIWVHKLRIAEDDGPARQRNINIDLDN
jgi:P4 family phage/plasmid primase-like protien